MSKNISTLSAIVISGIVFQIGYAIGSKFTTKLYKQCVNWAENGDEFEHIYGTAILRNALGIRYAKRPKED